MLRPNFPVHKVLLIASSLGGMQMRIVRKKFWCIRVIATWMLERIIMTG